MQAFPLMHVLFWIALILSPKDASQITITTENQSWCWSKQDSGWVQSVDQSAWKVDATKVTKASGQKNEQRDVGNFIKGVKEHDWSQSNWLLLGPMTTLNKVEDTFVYTLNSGDPTQKQFIISYKAKALATP